MSISLAATRVRPVARSVTVGRSAVAVAAALAVGCRTAYATLGGIPRHASGAPMRPALADGLVGLALSVVGAVVTISQFVPGPNLSPILLAAVALPAVWLGGVWFTRRESASRADHVAVGSPSAASAPDLAAPEREVRVGDMSACLWFQSEAEEAANFYVSLFPRSTITSVMRGAAGAPPVAVGFTLGDRPFLALNGRRERGFTDACSFVVPCETQADIDRVWDALTDGGTEGQCGWCTDRYGVSWQVVPSALGSLLGGSDARASGRAMRAMLGMRKFDIAALEEARRAT